MDFISFHKFHNRTVAQYYNWGNAEQRGALTCSSALSSASADTTTPELWARGQTTECVSDGPEVPEQAVKQRSREVTVVPLLEAGGSALVRRNKTITFAFANNFFLFFKASPCWTLTYQLKRRLNCAVFSLSVSLKEPCLKEWGMWCQWG